VSLLGISDPRRWSAGAWAADAIPHIAFGVVTTLAIFTIYRD
jgi:hypothetical protein